MKALIILLAISIGSNSVCLAATSELMGLRAQTRNLLMQRHCFNCHSKDGTQPHVQAMQIYNLDFTTWYSTMSARQLVDFKRRILEKLTPEELKEVGGNPKELPLTSAQKQLVAKFVELEIENRKLNPLDRVLGQ